MKRNFPALLVIAYCYLTPVLLQAQQTTNVAGIDAILLKSIHDNSVFRLQQSSMQLTAVVFLSPECPISQNYTLTLNQLLQKFPGQLSIIGVFPGSDYKDEAYTDFEKKYHVNFKLFKDNDGLMVKKLAATITPQVFLINSSQQVVYSGAIDDWAVSLGKMRRAASAHYLENAVANTLAGIAPKPVKTKAVGCFIN